MDLKNVKEMESKYKTYHYEPFTFIHSILFPS